MNIIEIRFGLENALFSYHDERFIKTLAALLTGPEN